MTEHKQKAEADHEKQEVRLEIHATVKKVVPGPGKLRPRHRNQLNSGEYQQNAADGFRSAGHK